MSGEPLASHDERNERFAFADQLENLGGDPAASFLALRAGLEQEDLDIYLGVPRDSKHLANLPADEGPAKTIDVVRNLTIFFSRHGTLSMPEQGQWLVEPNLNLWIVDPRSPLAFLRFGDQPGPNKDNIWRVLDASIGTVLSSDPSHYTLVAAWRVVSLGAGKLNSDLVDFDPSD